MFKNEYTMDKKLIKEYVLNVLCRRVFIIGVLVIFFSIFSYIFVTSSNTELFICGLTVFVMIFDPILIIKNFEEEAKRLNNGKIEKTVVEFDKNIVMNEGKVHLEFEYSQITKFKQTKNFYVLMLGNSNAVLVLKDGFVIGNKKDFVEHIINKIIENKGGLKK